jgi:hypothetical protein
MIDTRKFLRVGGLGIPGQVRQPLHACGPDTHAACSEFHPQGHGFDVPSEIVQLQGSQEVTMGAVYETVKCKGCGTAITIKTLEWPGDRTAYSHNRNFNADVPCEHCRETYSYRRDDIRLLEAVHS